MKNIIIITLLLSSIMYGNSICSMTMGYKSKDKEPYILKDNSGLYKELYTKALKDIGCTLKIERASKKRILSKIKSGEIDFYPGFNFSKKRASMVHYIANGLPKGFTAITQTNIPSLNSLQEIKNLQLRNITEKAGADLLAELKLKTIKVSDLNLKKAIQMIQKGRADIYIYNKSQIDFYIKKYKPQNIKSHSSLYKHSESLYLAFSKKSNYIQELKNKNFDNNLALSIENSIYDLEKSSTAYKFSLSLQNLKTSGYTDKLYNKYFK